MENLKSIIIRNQPVRIFLDTEDCQYKPLIIDLTTLVGLPFLEETIHLRELFKLLLNNRFFEALKFTAYTCDCKTKDAKIKLIRYLAVTIGIHLVCNQKKYNKIEFEIYQQFISGLSNYNYTPTQIIELIKLDIPSLPFNDL